MVTTKIGGRIESAASDKVVVGANAVYDDRLHLDQETINRSLQEQIDTVVDASFGEIRVSLETLVNGTKTSGEELVGVLVTLTNTTTSSVVSEKTIENGVYTVSFPRLMAGNDYSVSVSAINNYQTPAAVAITGLTEGSVITRTIQYQADLYTAVITSNQGSSDANIANAKITVAGTQLSNGGTIQLPAGTAINPTATDLSGSRYALDLTTSGKTITAAYATTYVKLNMVGLDNGVEGDYPTGAQGTVKYSGGTDQVLGNNNDRAQVPTGTAFTVEYAAVSEYSTPSTYSGTASGTSMTVDKATYASGLIQIEVTVSDNDDTDLAKVTASIAINGGTATQLTGTVESHKKTFQAAVTPGQSYVISFGVVEGYDTPANISGTKGSGVETKSASYTTVIYTASITSNQTNDSAISNVTVSVNYTGLASAKSLPNGGSIKVPTTLIPTASASDITGYAKSVTVDSTLHTITLAYTTELVSVALTKDGGEGDITPVVITMLDASNNTLGTGTGSISNLKVASGTVYHISLSNSPEGYTEPDVTATYTAASTANASRSISLMYEEASGFVDLGLSVKWAEGNIVKNGTKYSIGAPTDQGCYFSWGNVEGHNKGEGYDFSSTTYNSTSGSKLTADISATGGYDAARATLGGNWRMPTKAECEELINNCTCTWTTQDGVNGMRFTSKKSGYTGNSIFIPASGYYGGTSLSDEGSRGYYWSSTWNSSSSAWYLYFHSGDQRMNYGSRLYGFTVRAVS